MAESLARERLARILAPAARHLTRHRARVLFYHRFGEGPRRLSASAFETQLRYIRAHFNPISLSRLMDARESGAPLPPRAVVLTIDDGYEDFLTIAYPLLRQYAIPATVYVVSEFAAGHLWLWFDQIRFVCELAGVASVTLPTPHGELRLAFGTPEAREESWDRLATYAIALSPATRDGLIQKLARLAGVPIPKYAPERYRALSFEQLRALDPHLVELGAHTRTHATLSGCSTSQLRDEIDGSRADLERALDQPVFHFCYPNGQVGDFGPAAVQAVRAAGYRSASISFGGLVKPRSPSLLLPRIAASAVEGEFRRSLDGITHLNDRF